MKPETQNSKLGTRNLKPEVFKVKTTLPIDIVTLGEDNSYHLFVSGTINDQDYDLLIDTGASHTIFDANLIPEIPANELDGKEIKSAGIHAGEVKSTIGRIKKFNMGDLKRVNWMVVLIDLTHINDLYKKYTSKCVAGLIGSEFLLQHKAIIDYKKRELVLRNIRQKNDHYSINSSITGTSRFGHSTGSERITSSAPEVSVV